MRTRKCKTVDGVTYEKVDTSRFFKVKVRSPKSLFAKLEFIHTREIRRMFSHLTVDTILTDKREARTIMSLRDSVEEVVSYPEKTIVATEFKPTEDKGFGYPKFTPCKFIEQFRLVTETVPVVKWID